ncbi:MAG: hypothetical protein ABW179_01645 [Methylobacterium sp.]
MRDDIALGLLVAPCGFAPDGTRYGLIYMHDPAPGSPVETLRVWLQGEAATTVFERSLP